MLYFQKGGIDSSLIVTGDGNEINVGAGPRAKKGSLREAYLSHVLKEVSPLALSGVVRQSASEAETRLNLSAVYTSLRSIGPLPVSTLSLSSDNLKSLLNAGMETVDDVLNLLGHGEKSVLPSFDEKSLEELRERMKAKGYGEDLHQSLYGVSALWHLNKKMRLVLLGDPGSGKSTFVNFVALSMAGEVLGWEDANLRVLTQPLPLEQDDDFIFPLEEEKQESQPWDHGVLIPVRIILRDFAARGLPPAGEHASAEHVWNFIEAELNAASLNEFVPLLKKELRDTGGLVLLDGLDEVPEAEHRREQMRSAIESFVAAFPRCRYLVTSRTYAYQRQDWKLNGFDEAVLAPFTKGQIANFVERWYDHITLLRSGSLEDGKGKAEVLKRAIFSNDRLMSLAERPLLLTLMASIHAWRGGTLPEKRQELYADAVDLLLDWWESQRVVRDAKGNVTVIQPSLAEWLNVDRKKVRDLLNQLAYEAHAGQSDLTGTADVPENDLVSGLMKLNPNLDIKPARLIEYLRDRAGLLIPRGVGVYTFPHRTFQEYLAACYLTDHDYPDLIAKLARTEPNRWREVALLAGAKAAGGAAEFALWSLVDALSPERENGNSEAGIWGAQIAGQAVTEIADLEKVSDSTQPKKDRLSTRLLDIMEGNRLPAVERVQAGINLSALGDPRFNPDLWHLPNDETLGFLQIPAGKFLMGSNDKDEQASNNEKPQHEVDLPEYWMAKYPVTVVQFRAFVDATKYSFDNWRYNQISTYPVVAVTWYDALEYTKWLDKQLRGYAEKQILSGNKNSLWQGLADKQLQVILPSEAEWEKAVRGPSTGSGEGRIYPWGGDFDPDKANTNETKIGDQSVVGCFPNGASPYGLHDMSGNVWEWTRSLLGKWEDNDHKKLFGYPYNKEDGREDLNASKDYTRLLRGGSFLNLSELARCSSRLRLSPVNRLDFGGFRVVVSPFLTSS